MGGRLIRAGEAFGRSTQVHVLLGALSLFVCVAAAADGKALTSLVDNDNDGTFSQEEQMQVVDKLYSSLDTDNSGGISATELGREGVVQTKSDKDGNVQVSKSELKTFWTDSPVRSWTAEQVAVWLNAVGHGAHAPTFLAHKVDGKLLPALAMNSGALLKKNLAIVNEADRQQLTMSILHLVFGVPPIERSHLLEIILAIACVTLGGGSYFYSSTAKKSQDEQVVLSRRLQEVQNAANNTHSLLNSQLSEMASVAEKTKSELERLKQEKGKAAMLEQDSAKLNELLQASSQEKAKIQDWLTRKYTLEAKAIAESWKELSTQLASSRTRVDTITSSSSSFGIFKSSGKALEQSRAIEQIEIEVQQWQTRYKNFLETWLVVAELGYVDVPDIALRLNEIKRQEQSRPPKSPPILAQPATKIQLGQ